MNIFNVEEPAKLKPLLGQAVSHILSFIYSLNEGAFARCWINVETQSDGDF